MKTRNFILAILCCLSITGTAQETDSLKLSYEDMSLKEFITAIKNGDSIVIAKKKVDTTEVKAKDRANSWDFSIFTDFSVSTKKKKTEESRNSSSLTMGGTGFGFVSALNAPAGMKVDMGASHEIFFDLISYKKAYNYGRHHLSFGLGFNWKNYRMTRNTRYTKEESGITLTPYPENAQSEFSRLKIFSVTFPLRYKFKFHEDFAISTSAILHLNTYGSMKTQYHQDGKKIEENSKNVFQRPISIDLQAALHWKAIGAYVKYSPCKVLKEGRGPQFNGLSAGIIFGF